MSYITKTNSAAPSTPATGKSSQYVNTTGQTVELNATGVSNILNNTKNPNLVRNGGFWFAQRQNPAASTNYVTTTSRVITADGWGVINENDRVSYIRGDTVAAAESGLQNQYYGTFAKQTNTGKFIVSQMIESRDSVPLRGRTVRVQAWIKGTGSQVVNVALAYLSTSGTADASPATFISAYGANQVDPTLGTNVSYIAPATGVTGDNCTASTNCYKCNVTTSWQRFGGVFTVPANLRNLYVMFYTDSQLTVANGFSLSQVSLTDGPEIQDWMPASMQAELDRCMRYYWKTFQLDTAPATALGTATGELRHQAPKAGAVASVSPSFLLHVPLRTASPTVTFYNPSAANAQARDVTAGADVTVTTYFSGSEKTVSFTYTANAGTAVGNSIGVHMTADAEMI